MKKPKKKRKKTRRRSVASGPFCMVCALRAKFEAAGPSTPVHPGEPVFGYEVGYLHAMTVIMFYQRVADPDLSQLRTLFCSEHGRCIASQINARLVMTPVQTCHACRAVDDHRKTKSVAPPGALWVDGFVDGVAALVVHRAHADDFNCDGLRRSFCERHCKFIVLHAAPLIGWNNMPSSLVEHIALHIEVDKQTAKEAARTQN